MEKKKYNLSDILKPGAKLNRNKILDYKKLPEQIRKLGEQQEEILDRKKVDRNRLENTIVRANKSYIHHQNYSQKQNYLSVA